MPHPPESIVGARVLLRRISTDDARSLFLCANDDDVMRYMDWPHPKNVAETASHLEKAVKAWNGGTEFQWAILEQASMDVVGTISCRPKGHTVDFGYFLGRNHWSRGYAFDAVQSLVGWLYQQPAIIRIWATADAENARSRRVLERSGLKLEGIMNRATYRPNFGGGAYRNTALYALCKSEA